jgi:hypothetical protein
MQWALKILCKHPDVQRTLYSELLEKLPAITTRTPTYAEISDETNLPYLFAVLYEVLRCSRTVAVVTRLATRDTVLLGYPIPKGTEVLFPIGTMQQLESDASKDGLDSVRSSSSKGGRKTGYWSASDVHLFNPDRWLRQDGSFDANAGPWLPFSTGFRGCFGAKLAVSILCVSPSHALNFVCPSFSNCASFWQLFRLTFSSMRCRRSSIRGSPVRLLRATPFSATSDQFPGIRWRTTKRVFGVENSKQYGEQSLSPNSFRLVCGPRTWSSVNNI